jgi:hypothetical protein
MRMNRPSKKIPTYPREIPIFLGWDPQKCNKVTTIEAIGDTPSGKKIQRAWLNVEVTR